MNAFSERIKELRLERGLTQKEVAKLTGFTQPAIARWEAGLQVPNIETAIVFAKLFEVTTDYLLGLEN